MRKYLVAAMATSFIGIGFAAGNTPEEQLQPYSAQGRAYMTYDFGGPRRANDAALPLHYGFRIDSESRLAAERYTGVTDGRFPAIVQLDFSANGNRLALVNGVPFAGRSVMLRQNDGSSSPDSGAPSSGSTEPGGFTWFDWGLLVVGIGGAGYIISEVAKGKDSPDPQTTSSSGTTTGGTLGGLLGGATR